MKVLNELELKFKAISENESFARASVGGFCLQLNPTLEQLNDIKTSVSEAVTNCVVHAYPNVKGWVVVNVKLFENMVEIVVCDEGIGILNINQAREPFFTTKPDQERSGMGFTVMESFMDVVEVADNKKKGTRVVLKKYIDNQSEDIAKSV